MRAIVLAKAGEVAVVQDWPEPRPGPDEVIVQIHGVGLCGSDLAVYYGRRSVPELPWVMGHEGGGEIVAAGANVTDRSPGQRVVIEPNYCCHACLPCQSGSTSACTQRRSVGLNHPGLLAERVAVPARFAWPVPAGWPAELLACVEPVAVARSAVRRSRVMAGDRCLVIGAGSQGLLICQVLLAAGAIPVIVEPHPGRLALAQRLGAEPAEPAPAERFSFVFEAAGVPTALQTALDCAAPAATVTLIGLSSAAVPISAGELVRRQLTLLGSLIYDHPTDFADTIAVLARGDLDPARVVQPGFIPDRAAVAFAEAIKVPGKPWLDLSPWLGRSQRRDGSRRRAPERSSP